MAITFTYDETGSVCKIIGAWVSAAGTTNGTTKKISGRLLHGVTIPDAVAVPDINYDIVVTDATGVDVLGNCSDDLMNRHNVNTEDVPFYITDGVTTVGLSPAVCDPLTITISNTGGADAGTAIVYWQRA